MILLMVGCGPDRTETSVENFSRAIAEYHDNNDLVLHFTQVAWKFPMPYTTGASPDQICPGILADIGIVRIEPFKQTMNNGEEWDRYRYHLTEEGKRYYDEADSTFSLGTLRVTEIVDHTDLETAEQTGRASVGYTVEIGDKPAWVEDGRLETALRKLGDVISNTPGRLRRSGSITGCGGLINHGLRGAEARHRLRELNITYGTSSQIKELLLLFDQLEKVNMRATVILDDEGWLVDVEVISRTLQTVD